MKNSLRGSIFDDPALFIDRDFSLIEFQRRVFDEARDENNPLLERVNFLSIVVSNFDEFEMIRMPQLARARASDEDSQAPLTDPLRHFDRLRTEMTDDVADAGHRRKTGRQVQVGAFVLHHQAKELVDRGLPFDSGHQPPIL